jgi:hypothetical protein
LPEPFEQVEAELAPDGLFDHSLSPFPVRAPRTLTALRSAHARRPGR